jgi:hypothetical protein
MDAGAVAQSLGGTQWTDIKANCDGLFVCRGFSQLQRNSSETTAWLVIWTEFLVVSLQDMSLIKFGN